MGMVFYKGIVVSEKKRCYVVLTNDYQYIKIKKNFNTHIGNEIYVLEDDLYTASNVNYRLISTVAASFVAIMIMIPLLYMYKQDQKVAAVISMDINPSLEFEIDSQNKILNILTFNEDAKILIDKKVYKGKNVYDVIIELINESINLNYLRKDNNEILFAKTQVKDNNNFYIDQIENKLKGYTSNYKIRYIDVENKEDLEQSRQKNVSIGKYEIENKSEKILNVKYISDSIEVNSTKDQNEALNEEQIKEQNIEKKQQESTKENNNENHNKSDKQKSNEQSVKIDKPNNDKENNISNNTQNESVNNKLKHNDSNNKNNGNNKNKHKEDKLKKEADKLKSKELGIPYGQYKKKSTF